MVKYALEKQWESSIVNCMFGVNGPLFKLRDVKITSTFVVCPKSCDEGLKSTRKRSLTLKNFPMSVSNC